MNLATLHCILRKSWWRLYIYNKYTQSVLYGRVCTILIKSIFFMFKDPLPILLEVQEWPNLILWLSKMLSQSPKVGQSLRRHRVWYGNKQYHAIWYHLGKYHSKCPYKLQHCHWCQIQHYQVEQLLTRYWIGSCGQYL